jgi:hypothetical protein
MCRGARRGAMTGRAMTGRAATLPLVRMDREATRPVPINRRAPTTPLVATTGLGQAIATQAGSSVRAASARDAADAGVAAADAMEARTPPTCRRTAMMRPLKAVATPTAGPSSRRGRMRLRTPIQRLVPIRLLVPRRWLTLKRPPGRRLRPGRTRQPLSNEHPRCRRRLRPTNCRRRGRSKRHRRRPGTTANMSCGRPPRAMCRAAVPTTASPGPGHGLSG